MSATPLSAHCASLVARLRSHPTFDDPYEVHSPSSDGKRAAVAVLLVPSDSGQDLEVVLTKRQGTMAWANEVVFPGGKLDATDPTLTFTALREADEEIALFRGLVAHPKPGQPPLNTSEHTIETDLLSLELLNALPLHLAKDSLIVNPFVYLLLPRPGFIPIRNTREVAPKGVFRIPLSYFLGPGFEYTVEGTEERRRPPDSVRHSVSTSWWKSRKVHYFDVPAKIWESDEPDGSEAMHKVTWMTADILVEVASIAYGAQPTFEFNDDWAPKVSQMGYWTRRKQDEARVGKL